MPAVAKLDRSGRANTAFIALICALVVLVLLGWAMLRMDGDKAATGDLMIYCAAGTRPAMAQIIEQYKREYDVEVSVQYQGSNTLLSQIEASKRGDIYIAADDSYIELGQKKGLVREALPVAQQRLVIAVKKGNPKNIKSVRDLMKEKVSVIVGNPEMAAVGKITAKVLGEVGLWKPLDAHITNGGGTYKATVPAVANDVQIGNVDAGIVWNATLANYPELEGVRCPELDPGAANISIGVLSSATDSARALHFARYVSAPEKGQEFLRKKGFDGVAGDPWAEVPELTFFVGAVNRRAIEPVIDRFRKRENARINTKYNGCGILVGDMKVAADRGTGFPDTFMACDVYYLNVVQDWFEAGVEISDTRLVLVVPKGNPAEIESLSDLAKPGLRIALGQPEQCTIGILSKQLLEAEGLADRIAPDNVIHKANSSQLVPDAAAGTVDAVLAYATDAMMEQANGKVDVIEIDSRKALAVQPFSVAKRTPNKMLAARLFDTLRQSKASFTDAGFGWRLDGTAKGSRRE